MYYNDPFNMISCLKTYIIFQYQVAVLCPAMIRDHWYYAEQHPEHRPIAVLYSAMHCARWYHPMITQQRKHTEGHQDNNASHGNLFD